MNGLMEKLVMTGQLFSFYQSWQESCFCAPSPVVGRPWEGSYVRQAQIKFFSWSLTGWEGSNEEESTCVGVLHVAGAM